MDLPGITGEQADDIWAWLFILVLGLGAIAIAFLVFWYLYTSYFTMKIAERLGSNNASLAWIPILNLYLLCEIAANEDDEVFSGFSPKISFIIVLFSFGLALIPVWIAIARKLNKSEVLGISNALLGSLLVYWIYKDDKPDSIPVE